MMRPVLEIHVSINPPMLAFYPIKLNRKKETHEVHPERDRRYASKQQQ
jgi:hypothetical protein